MVCCEKLGPGIHGDVVRTCITHLNITADEVYTFTATAGSPQPHPTQQDNVPRQTTNTIQEWLTCPPNSADPNLIVHF